jgi:macrolide-specific efflux system membrane fusion protein
MKWLTENSSDGRGREVRFSARFLRRLPALAAVLLAFTLSAGGCALLPDEGEEEALPDITPPQISKKPEYEVTTATLESKVQAIGKIMSEEEETLFFELDGKRLRTLNVKPGDHVEAGQIIAALDVDDMEKDLRQRKLQFRTMERTMKDALRRRDEMDPVEFEQTVIAFEEQRQSIVDLENEIAKAVLTAPFTGTIVQVNVEKGAQIRAYDPIVTIADTGRLVVTANFSKSDREKIAIGMPAVVDINGAGKFEGKVSLLPVANSDDEGNGGWPPQQQQRGERPEDYVQIEIGEIPEGVNRGTPLSANVIVSRKENAIVIPPSALRTIGARTYVQVVEQDGSKREVDVAVGQQTATLVEIIEGLKPGQKVVGR